MNEFDSKPKRFKAQEWNPAESNVQEFRDVATDLGLFVKVEGDELIIIGDSGKFGVRPGQIAVFSADVYGGLDKDQFEATYVATPPATE